METNDLNITKFNRLTIKQYESQHVIYVELFIIILL